MNEPDIKINRSICVTSSNFRAGHVFHTFDARELGFFQALGEAIDAAGDLQILGTPCTLTIDFPVSFLKQIEMRSKPQCPACGAKEVEAFQPHTVYACGSTDYDQRPGTFKMRCHGNSKD